MKKGIDRLIGVAWHKYASGIQVSIMDLPAIFKDMKTVLYDRIESGETTENDFEHAVKTVAKRYRVN